MKSSKANRVPVFGFTRVQSAALVLGVAAIALLCAGCATRSVYNDSERKVKTRAAIQARDLGDGAAGIGVDVAALDVLAEQPMKQLGAAILDAGAIYGGYLGVREISDQISDGGGNDSAPAQPIATRSSPIRIDGDGNSVSIDMHSVARRK